MSNLFALFEATELGEGSSFDAAVPSGVVTVGGSYDYGPGALRIPNLPTETGRTVEFDGAFGAFGVATGSIEAWQTPAVALAWGESESVLQPIVFGAPPSRFVFEVPDHWSGIVDLTVRGSDGSPLYGYGVLGELRVSDAAAPPSGGITFTQTNATPTPELDAVGYGQLALIGRGYQNTLAELGAAGGGALAFVQGTGGTAAGAVSYGIGTGTLAMLGYGLAPGVEAPAEGAGTLALRGRGYESADFGAGTLGLLGYATSFGDDAVLPSPVGSDVWVSLQDLLAFSDTTIDRVTYALRAAFGVDDGVKTRWQAQGRLRSDMALADELSSVYRELLASGFVLIDAADANYRPLLAMHDKLVLTGQVLGSREAWMKLAEAIAFGSAFEATTLWTFEAGLSLADEAQARLIAAMKLIDSILLGGALTDTVVFGILLADGLVLTEQFTGMAELHALLQDAIGFTMHLRIKDAHYVAWTMNTDSKASTKYEAYPFNSFMRVGGRTYAAADHGLFRIGGDTDAGAPVSAHIRLGLSAFGSRMLKQVPSLYLGYSSTGDMLIKAIIASSDTGEREAHVYRLYANGRGATREGRTKFGRGLEAVYYDFQVENVGGADFEIDNLEFMPVTINRRLRGNAGGR